MSGLVDLSGLSWRKSTRSAQEGNCVEVAFFDTGVAVRDSKDPNGPALVFTPAEWEAFIGGVQDGEFE